MIAFFGLILDFILFIFVLFFIRLSAKLILYFAETVFILFLTMLDICVQGILVFLKEFIINVYWDLKVGVIRLGFITSC